jgi:spermidine/putrescine transport system permease protein
MLVFLYAPIAVLVAYSFNESRSRANWGGFTLKWYVELFNNPNIINALVTTLTVAVLSAVAATVIGTSVAFGLNAMRGVRKRVLLSLTNIPVVSPDIVIGISLMVLFIYFFGVIKVGGLGYHTLLLSHIIFNIPFVILSVLPKLRQLDNNLYEAALDLGAKPVYAFVHRRFRHKLLYRWRQCHDPADEDIRHDAAAHQPGDQRTVHDPVS